MSTPAPPFIPGRFADRTAVVAGAGLAADRLEHVNGAILPSDGGWSAI